MDRDAPLGFGPRSGCLPHPSPAKPRTSAAASDGVLPACVPAASGAAVFEALAPSRTRGTRCRQAPRLPAGRQHRARGPIWKAMSCRAGHWVQNTGKPSPFRCHSWAVTRRRCCIRREIAAAGAMHSETAAPRPHAPAAGFMSAKPCARSRPGLAETMCVCERILGRTILRQ